MRVFRLYPDANMDMMGALVGFDDTYCCPYFLDPTETLFNEIGRAFMDEVIIIKLRFGNITPICSK